MSTESMLGLVPMRKKLSAQRTSRWHSASTQPPHTVGTLMMPPGSLTRSPPYPAVILILPRMTLSTQTMSWRTAGRMHILCAHIITKLLAGSQATLTVIACAHTSPRCWTVRLGRCIVQERAVESCPLDIQHVLCRKSAQPQSAPPGHHPANTGPL